MILFVCLGVALHVCKRFVVLLYGVQGGMHTFDSQSLSLPSPALHSTLNRMAISLSFTQIDTYPHTYRHSPCFCLQEYVGVKPNSVSDMMGAFAKTRPGLASSLVDSLFIVILVLFLV